jgi:predicted phosphoribosyltransferase
MQTIKDKNIFILDDGLASGFTMLAAINMIKKFHPTKIFIAVPTAPLRTIKNVKPEVDEIFCPNVREVIWFAVADAYRNWYDVPESEVLEIITKSNYYISPIK